MYLARNFRFWVGDNLTTWTEIAGIQEWKWDITTTFVDATTVFASYETKIPTLKAVVAECKGFTVLSGSSRDPGQAQILAAVRSGSRKTFRIQATVGTGEISGFGYFELLGSEGSPRSGASFAFRFYYDGAPTVTGFM